MSQTDWKKANLRIGFFLNKTKREKFGLLGIENYAKQNTASQVIIIDLDSDLENQGPFDVVLVKVTDEMTTNDKELLQKIEKLELYLSRFPKTVQIDPISLQRNILDRVVTNDLLEKVKSSLEREGVHILNPQFRKIGSLEECKTLTHFPACPKFKNNQKLIKPIQACGSTESHLMTVVFEQAQLFEPSSKIAAPFAIQEFYNHNAVIFKVFVLGSYVSVVKRLSLPNMPEKYPHVIHFDSQKPITDQFSQVCSARAFEEISKNIESYHDPDSEILGKIIEHLKKSLGFSVFGFDIIQEITSKKFAIIDVNYFPSFRGVEDLNGKILQHLITEYQNASKQ